MSIPDADNIVYNFSLYNNTNDNISAERYISRDQPFINETEKYYARIIGLNVTSLSIPLFFYERDMYITIDNAGFEKTALVEFEPLFELSPNDVIFIQQFLNGVNKTLKSLHFQTFSPGNPPKFIYENEVVTLIVDQLYDPLQNIIYLNEKLGNMFPALYSKNLRTQDRVIALYGDYGNTMYNSYPGGISYPCYAIKSGVTGYKTLQEFFNILVSTNSMPINKQNISNQANTTQTFGILDIIPIDYEDVINGSPINYTQQVPSYNDFLNRGSLSEIDFKLYLVDKNYRVSPLFLAPGESVTCRFEFISKELVKNYYPETQNNIKERNNFLSFR